MPSTEVTTPGEIELVRSFVNTIDYEDGTEAFGSVWNNANGNYVQTIVSSGMQTTFSSMTGCSYAFSDLQVMRVDEGARVFLAYQTSSSCGGDVPLRAHGRGGRCERQRHPRGRANRRKLDGSAVHPNH